MQMVFIELHKVSSCKQNNNDNDKRQSNQNQMKHFLLSIFINKVIGTTNEETLFLGNFKNFLQCKQMDYIEQSRKLQRVSSSSPECMQMVYIKPRGFHLVSSCKLNNNHRKKSNQSQTNQF
jgi:hypothetical protein